MAIMTLKGTTGVGVVNVATLSAISHITQASMEISAGTVVKAKNNLGDIKAVLVGKPSVSMSISGYSTNKAGAALGDTMTVAGQTGKVVSSSIEATAEDFSKFSAQGRAV